MKNILENNPQAHILEFTKDDYNHFRHQTYQHMMQSSYVMTKKLTLIQYPGFTTAHYLAN